jgi:hypothetical protein
VKRAAEEADRHSRDFAKVRLEVGADQRAGRGLDEGSEPRGASAPREWIAHVPVAHKSALSAVQQRRSIKTLPRTSPFFYLHEHAQHRQRRRQRSPYFCLLPNRPLACAFLHFGTGVSFSSRRSWLRNLLHSTSTHRSGSAFGRLLRSPVVAFEALEHASANDEIHSGHLPFATVLAGARQIPDNRPTALSLASSLNPSTPSGPHGQCTTPVSVQLLPTTPPHSV